VSEPEIAFACRQCGGEATADLDGRGNCRTCGEAIGFEVPPLLKELRIVERCPACLGEQLYVQRDFNQKAGIAIVVLGAILAPFTYYLSLVLAALIDAGLYMLLPEITICYRCQAHFRGFRHNPTHKAFDLHVAEQYELKPPKG